MQVGQVVVREGLDEVLPGVYLTRAFVDKVLDRSGDAFVTATV